MFAQPPAARKRALSPDLSPSSYATMILDIANQLTQKDLADAKCWLAIDGLLTESELRDIKYQSDLFRVLKFKNILPKEGESLEPLMQLMINIRRDDLKNKIEEYAATGFKNVQAQCSKIRNIYRYRHLDDSDSMSVISSSSSSSSNGRQSVPPFTQLRPAPHVFRAPGPVSRSASDSEMDDVDGAQESQDELRITASAPPPVSVAVSVDGNAPPANDVPPSPIRASRLHLPGMPPIQLQVQAPVLAPSEDVININ